MRIVRTIGGQVLSAISADHTQSFHLVKIDLDGGSLYLSEGPQFVHEGDIYLEGRVKVSGLRWSGDGAQYCSLEIQNEGNFAALLMLNNQIADAAVTIWTVSILNGGASAAPVLYATGACDASELSPEVVRITVLTSKYRTAFMPNYYMGAAGFNHLPPENAVVVWNSTAYLLTRES